MIERLGSDGAAQSHKYFAHETGQSVWRAESRASIDDGVADLDHMEADIRPGW